jgi:hypothetical protein
MTIVRISQYQTSDGATFADRQAAEQHENEIEAIGKLSSILSSSIQTGRIGAVLKEILFEANQVNDILKGYIRHLPKATKERVAA